MTKPLLSIENININYGSIKAIYNLSLKVFPKEVITILGANGAGKTTILKAISGLLKLKSGKIIFDGEKIHNKSPHYIVSKGISHSPEGRMVFPEMTVAENLDMGSYLRVDKKQIQKDKDYIFKLFPRLKERHKQLAGTLSGGEQQMLAISRAFMASPRLLLLDEPSLGIAPILVKTIFNAIVDINKQRGSTIILVEQNARISLKVAQRGYVLTTGQLFMEDSSKNLLNNKEIQKAYLGH